MSGRVSPWAEDAPRLWWQVQWAHSALPSLSSSPLFTSSALHRLIKSLQRWRIVLGGFQRYGARASCRIGSPVYCSRSSSAVAVSLPPSSSSICIATAWQGLQVGEGVSIPQDDEEKEDNICNGLLVFGEYEYSWCPQQSSVDAFTHAQRHDATQTTQTVKLPQMTPTAFTCSKHQIPISHLGINPIGICLGSSPVVSAAFGREAGYPPSPSRALHREAYFSTTAKQENNKIKVTSGHSSRLKFMTLKYFIKMWIPFTQMAY